MTFESCMLREVKGSAEEIVDKKSESPNAISSPDVGYAEAVPHGDPDPTPLNACPPRAPMF